MGEGSPPCPLHCSTRHYASQCNTSELVVIRHQCSVAPGPARARAHREEGNPLNTLAHAPTDEENPALY